MLEMLLSNNKGSGGDIILPAYIGPGPTTLIGEYTDPNDPAKQHGFFGEVVVEDFITYSSLSTTVNYSRGSLINVTTPWLKFYSNGAILFTPRIHIRDYCQWNALNTLGLVYGETVIEILGHYYKVRLMRGGNSDPSTGPGGEWDTLMYSISARKPLGWSFADYTDAELGVDAATNRGTVCMETSASNSSYNISRGNGAPGITNYLSNTPKNYAGIYAVWRPVLELIN